MSICIIQPTANTKYLRLGSYDFDTNSWSYRSTLIPVEVLDTRFRDAVRLLSHGWQLFTLDGKVYRVSDALRAEIENDIVSPNRGIETRKIDFSGFWHRYEQTEKMKRDPVGTTLDSKVSLLLARYKAGEKLPGYVLATIKKYI